MRILIVDDSSFVLMVGRRSLEKSGHTVVGEAFDGKDAVKKAWDLRPELVIMDIALPLQNGFEATRAILEEQPRVKVLAISAIDEDWVREKAFESGCYDFLPKPFDTIQLLEAVNRSGLKTSGVRYG